jgi:hypothetical protein
METLILQDDGNKSEIHPEKAAQGERAAGFLGYFFEFSGGM